MKILCLYFVCNPSFSERFQHLNVTSRLVFMNRPKALTREEKNRHLLGCREDKATANSIAELAVTSPNTEPVKAITEKLINIIDEKLKTFSTTLVTIETKLDVNVKRIEEGEKCISTAEDSMLTVSLTTLEKTVENRTETLSNFKNRSRRGNINISNLREGTEVVSPIQFFGTWLPTLLGLETKKGIMKID